MPDDVSSTEFKKSEMGEAWDRGGGGGRESK